MRLARLLIVVALTGCAGEVGAPPGGGGDGDAGVGAACEGLAPTPGPSPLRRLNRFEYDNTVRDLLGDDSRPARDFPPEEESLGFDNNASALGVTQLLAEHYLTTAETLAARAAAPDKLLALLGCDPAADAACVERFVIDFGLRAWRRPLEPDEVSALEALHQVVRERYDEATAVQAVLTTMLQSPHFLYRVELGPGESLDGWQLATRLSYLVWGSMPDDALFAAAAAGELVTREQVETQARRLLADPRAHEQVRHFHDQWLLLYWLPFTSKDASVYPGFDVARQDALREEALAFVDDVFWSERTVDALLTAPYTVRDGARVELDPARHAGVLTQPGLLAVLAKPDQTSPVQRGKFVRERLLCQPLPPPPPDVDTTPPDLNPSLTTRERFAAHTADPVCAGCHHLMDPIGFGFEHFDGAGEWRADENGLAIDASGEILDADDASGSFDGVPALAAQLAGSDAVRTCVTRQWFRYGYGRGETDDDTCTLARLDDGFAASGGDLVELLVALTQTDAFMLRTVAP